MSSPFCTPLSLKIHHTTLKGSEYLMVVSGSGKLVGEVEILTNEYHICSVKALTDCRLGVVGKISYQNWLREDHSFSLLVNQAICFRLQKISARAAMHLNISSGILSTQVYQECGLGKSCPKTVHVKKRAGRVPWDQPKEHNRILKKFHEQEILSVSRDELRVVSMNIKTGDHLFRKLSIRHGMGACLDFCLF